MPSHHQFQWPVHVCPLCILYCFAYDWGKKQLDWSTYVHVLFTDRRALIHRSQSQEQKVRCLVHYFERVTDSTPTGFVSFERKVLPRRGLSDSIPYPDIHAWLASSAPLCQFRVRDHCILMGTQEKDEGQKYHFLWPVYAVKSSWRAMSAKIARMYQMLSFNGKYV